VETQPDQVCLRCAFRIAPGLHGRALRHLSQPCEGRRYT
jgi:hypothetical protein